MLSKKIHPYVFIILTFVSVILTGTLLLMLPFASADGHTFGFVNSLFMATSAVCVTGLSVMNISVEMTLFGKIIMCLLMEIGGLSFITIAVFFFTIIGAKIGLSNRFLLREALNQSSVKGIVSLVKKIIILSLIFQTIGIVFLMFSMMPYCNNNFGKALWYSIFHSVSAFNNSGFDLFGDSSLIAFKDDTLLNLSMMFLIIFGGTGFIIFDDILKNKKWKFFSLHTKITLIFMLVLIIGGGLLFKLTVKDMSWLQAFFASVTCRTAGFTTYDMSNLTSHPAGYLVSLVLMFIGASPCSTGGGIKTTTVAVVILAVVHYARGKKTKAFQRSIADGNIFKAFILVVIGIIIILIGSFIILMLQPGLGLEKTVFEITSAFTTTGLSMGITEELNSVSRVVVSIIMLLGRLGPLTVIGVVNKNWMSTGSEDIKYIEESVIIG